MIAAAARLNGVSAAASVIGMLATSSPAAGVWFVASLIFAWALHSANTLPQEKRRRQDAVKKAEGDVEVAKRALSVATAEGEREMRTAGEQFRAKRQALERARHEHGSLPQGRARALARLDAERRELQMRAYLQRFHIRRTKIPDIGPARSATLAAFGIETAADVTPERLTPVPRLGAGYGSLIAWRRTHERDFVFDASKPVDPTAVREVDQRLARKRHELETELRTGAHELRQLSARGAQRHQAFGATVERCATDVEQRSAELRQARLELAVV